MSRPLILLSCLAGFAAVALGAFGAHAIGDRLSAEALEWWQTATLYLLVHAAAGLAAGQTRTFQTAGIVMVLGALWFAVTLYAMALGAPRWFGALTPIGGLAMLSGWVMIAVAAARSR